MTYKIITDVGCDMEVETLKEWDVECVDLLLSFVGENEIIKNSQINIKDFYQRMRDGGVAKTSAANSEDFKNIFKKFLDEGRDVFYIGFSGGMSTTFNSSRLAAMELSEEYPDRKIIVCDSLCASAGQGMLVYLAVMNKKAGMDLETNYNEIEKIKLNICHWVTVADLVYLKRGGRISATSAFVGNLLGIKPIIHVDNEGHLVNVQKVKGRRGSIKKVASKYGELAKEIGKGPIFISHGDCLEEAEMLKDILLKDYNANVDMIVNIGSVIGAHAGPGTIALFFIGKER